MKPQRRGRSYTAAEANARAGKGPLRDTGPWTLSGISRVSPVECTRRQRAYDVNDTNELNIVLNYRMRRWLHLHFGYRYATQNSTDEDYVFDKNVFVIGVRNAL